MADITVPLTDTQTKCLESIAYSVQDWCDNAIHNRARIAQEEIIAALLTHCNSNGVSIATGVDAQVTQAYSLGIVDTVKNIQDAEVSP
jgi:hypothetical protein